MVLLVLSKLTSQFLSEIKMAQEFTINSTAIEDKINQLLPSQGGFQPGVDFSASTMVIPIVDLTETAEGSDVQVNLQTALSLNSITTFSVQNATNTTLINTTGYYRIFGTYGGIASGSASMNLTDGTTTKNLFLYESGSGGGLSNNFDFVIFLQAGQSLRATSSADVKINGNTRQIADLSGNLVQPL